MDDLFARLRQRWPDAAHGVSADAIATFQSVHGVILPADLAAFYRAFDGSSGMGQDLFSFAPLAEVARVSDLPETRFVFADWLLSSHAYAVDLGSGPTRGRVYIVHSPDVLRSMSPDFTTFLAAYLHDPKALLVA
jgi:hypothetical protein